MIYVESPDGVKIADAKGFAQQYGYTFIDNENNIHFESRQKKQDNVRFIMSFTREGISLNVVDGRDKYSVCVDFISGGRAHRRKFGGGNGQQVAKAVGLNKGFFPRVLDATAGLGGDAFVLACLGCSVHMIERSPIARTLLADGLMRAKLHILDEACDDDELPGIISRMGLFEGDSLSLLSCDKTPKVDVVYLDPMFPERKKSAQVKKEMRAFHRVIGDDNDADKLLNLALQKAIYRVVVKRSKVAPFLGDQKPSFQLLGKSSRFDIYTNRALPCGDKYEGM